MRRLDRLGEDTSKCFFQRDAFGSPMFDRRLNTLQSLVNREQIRCHNWGSLPWIEPTGFEHVGQRLEAIKHPAELGNVGYLHHQVKDRQAILGGDMNG